MEPSASAVALTRALSLALTPRLEAPRAVATCSYGDDASRHVAVGGGDEWDEVACLGARLARLHQGQIHAPSATRQAYTGAAEHAVRFADGLRQGHQGVDFGDERDDAPDPPIDAHPVEPDRSRA